MAGWGRATWPLAHGGIPVVTMALSNAYCRSKVAQHHQRYHQCVVLTNRRSDPHVRWCERGRLAAAPYSLCPRLNNQGFIVSGAAPREHPHSGKSIRDPTPISVRQK